MERSRQRTPIIQRSKVAAVIALVVGFGCAVFGVGGAAAGNGAYVRHVREARLESKLAGLALAHRTPAQLVLAMTPKATAVKAAVTSTPAAPPAATPAPTPAATTTPATTATSATTTTAAATTTAPATTTPTTSDSSNGAESATESAATGTNPDGTPILTDTTAGTTTTGTATTGTTTTGTTTTGTTTTGTTTTGTATTGTTTTGTTTTGTTTTGTTTTSTAAPAATSTTATTTTGTTTTPCHGRCTTTTGTTGVVPAALPSTSSGTSTNFTLATSAVTQPSVATSAPTSNVASTPALPTQPASTPTPAGTTSPSSNGSTNLPLLSIPPLKLKVASHGSASHRSGATAPTTPAGTGAATAAGNTGTGPAGTAAAGTQPTTTSAKHAGAHRAPKHQASGGSGLSSPISSGVKVIDHFVKVIPTAVWVALGAAFALMLAFAGIALRSGRRARRREKEFAAISAAALTDALTGIFNRRGFTEAAERELARASRYDRPFVLAYVDVRGLKSVNDTEGHLMGDELIKTVAGLMKESGRADDVVGRIGGDEFALLLAEQTAESAGPVIRRIRARVAEARAEMEISVPWELTIGVASFPDDGKTLEELLDVSDRRLYEQRGIALR
jgi:diguanylate cyclase (GGDEF)-like protein